MPLILAECPTKPLSTPQNIVNCPSVPERHCSLLLSVNEQLSDKDPHNGRQNFYSIYNIESNHQESWEISAKLVV